MASSLNKIILIGNVGKDPEIRTTADGREIANFSMATTDRWKEKSSGNLKERTEWHKVVVFNENLSNLIKLYVKKGSRLYIEGSIQNRKWTDINNIERYVTEVVVQGYNSNIILLDTKKSDSNLVEHNTEQEKGEDSKFDHSDLDDEIPF